MRNAILKTTLAALVLSSPLAATEAMAKIKDIKFHFVSSPYEDYPVFEMKFQSGKWNWVNKGKTFKPRMKYHIKHNVVNGQNTIATLTTYVQGVPVHFRKRPMNNEGKLVTLNIKKNVLGKVEAAAKGACATHGGNKKVIKEMGLVGQIKGEKKVFGETKQTMVRNSTLIAKVVCHPKGSAGNSHGPILAGLKLYSIPAKPKCGQPVTMITQVQTANPGKVNFLYYRGDGEKQKASVVTTKVGKNYIGQWKKTYTFKKTTNRKYMVTAIGHKASTPWVPLKVNCPKPGANGKAS